MGSAIPGMNSNKCMLNIHIYLGMCREEVGVAIIVAH